MESLLSIVCKKQHEDSAGIYEMGNWRLCVLITHLACFLEKQVIAGGQKFQSHRFEDQGFNFLSYISSGD